MLKKISLFLLLLCVVSTNYAQQTTVYTEANESFKKGKDFYDKRMYGPAEIAFNQSIDLLRRSEEHDSKLLRAQAELYVAKAEVRQEKPDGEKKMLDYIRRYSPDPSAGQAVYEMGNYYFNKKEYDKANEFYSMVNQGDLPAEQRMETRFKQGYGLFVQKKFGQAKTIFKTIKDQEGEYALEATYYYGMCAFFDSNYNEAIKSFEKVSSTPKYKDHVPYYLCQIYFAKKEYDKVISYGESIINSGKTRNIQEINQLIGQSYFEKENYAKAVTFLESAGIGSSLTRDEDYYQLGFAQYKTEQYKKAITNLEKLNKSNTKYGQNAMFCLGDSYLKTGQKNSARNAFAAASKMSFDPAITEDALYNYAKLCYELKYDREAITALQTIKPSSKYYTEAQGLLGDVFLTTRDFEQALNILENIPDKTPKIKETYQKVCYMRGVQLYRDGDMAGAKRYLNKSMEFPVDAVTKAMATFWIGDIAYNNNEYDVAIREMDKFLTMEKSLSGFPPESSEYTANYTMGYAYLKKKDYANAQTSFNTCVTSIKKDQASIKNNYITGQVLGDAVLRTGDCFFKRNKYDDAIKYYDEAITKKYNGFVYALYQKAIIEGLRGRVESKLIALERLTDQYPESEYADEALLQMGITYQEINQLDKAQAPLKKLIANYKGKTEYYNQALLRLGLISFNQGNTQAAINYYKQVFSNNPDAQEAKVAMTALEEIYVDQLGKPDEYFAFLETIPGYDVDSYAKDSINYKAALSQFEQGNYDKAIEAFTNYINKYPTGGNLLPAYFNRGECYASKKQYSLALKDYQFVASKGGGKYYVKALNKGAIIAYNHEKDFAKAFDLYSKLDKAATLDETRFEAQLGALRCAYRLNKSESVIEYANKVINNPKATNDNLSVANFYLGKAAFDKQDYTKALQALTQVAKQSDNEQTAEANYLIAQIYYHQRNLDKAMSTADAISQTYPFWVAKGVILQADIYMEQGDLFNARASLEAVIENFDGDATIVNEAKQKLKKIEDKENAGSNLKAKPPTDSGALELDESGGQ